MTSVLARIGAFESRLASQSIWSSGKRKRGERVCAECRNRRALRQRRAYSDDTLNPTVGQFLFPQQSTRNEEVQGVAPIRRVARSRAQLGRPWGLGSRGKETRTREEHTPRDDEAEEGVADQQQIELWEKFEQAEDDGDEQVLETPAVEAVDSRFSLREDASLLDLDYASELSPALSNNAPDTVARCLLAASRRDDLDFIRSIPSTTFLECLRLLQPSNFAPELTTTRLELSAAMHNFFGIQTRQQSSFRYSKLLQEVLAIRRSAGVKIGFDEYKILLRSARDLGQKSTAIRLWQNMLADGLTPDTACYNYYMASVVWNGIHNPLAAQNMRVIPFHVKARQVLRPGSQYSSYSFGAQGVKATVLKVFSDMLKHGAVADEDSFRNVMTAAAREGDLTTIKSVLRKVWDIDVDALLASKDEASIVPKAVDKDSPLRPTTKLLFSIAHAFAINNDIPTALRLVDFVARQYNLEIDMDVWTQLFEWTFMLASPRTGVKAKAGGLRTGQLPKQSVLNLWKTMTGPPYLIQPTIGMYNHLIRNLQQRDWSPQLYEKMCEGRELYFTSRTQSLQCFRRLKQDVDQLETPADTPVLRASIEHLRREFDHLDLLRKRNLFFCKRWLRLLLSTMRPWVRVDEVQEWSARTIPRILWDWRCFAPAKVRYECSGGTVEFESRTTEEVEEILRRGERIVRRREEVLAKVPLLMQGQRIERAAQREQTERGAVEGNVELGGLVKRWRYGASARADDEIRYHEKEEPA